MNPSQNQALEAARQSMLTEAAALATLPQRLDADFMRAVDILAAHQGKVIISGMGKSGHIAQKIAATLSSTGTPAVFMHAGEARHGDLGIYHPGDPTILISKSGSTEELVYLIPILRDFNSSIIGIVGNRNSAIARHADVVLDASVIREADPLGLAPTSSIIAALAFGDALAAALITVKGFGGEDFARFHPAGQLGRNLLNRVGDVMQPADRIPWVESGQSLREVVIAMSRFPQGACCVGSPDSPLQGLITEGDIRRILERVEDIRGITAATIMTPSPTCIRVDAPLADAIKTMEDRPRQIGVLPVLDAEGKHCVGLLRIHDAYQPHRSASSR